MDSLGVLVVGCGSMGSSHARAYHAIDGFHVTGVVSRGAASRTVLAAELEVPAYESFEQGIAAGGVQVVSVNTHPDSHYRYALAALQADCHLFVEKPLAETVAEARELAATARARGRKVVVGYILRHHPSWRSFIHHARGLGTPLVMRMNLNQQSSGAGWRGHRNLMRSMSPIVDCGVHYVDVMCQMTGAAPLRVHAIGARLSDEIAADMYNYGQLQVTFGDGSVGWYEAGWGPMMSETAYFVKDVIGPRGSVSMVDHPPGESAQLAAHTSTGGFLIHHAETAGEGFARADRFLDTSDEPDHDALCRREQRYLLEAIRNDRDLEPDLEAAVNSLRIVLAADQSVRTGQVVELA